MEERKRAMGKVLKEEEFEQVLFHAFVLKEPNIAIADALNLSRPTVRAIIDTFSLLKEGNTDELARRAVAPGNSSFSIPILKMAAGKLGLKEVPRSLVDAYNDRNKKRAQERAQPKEAGAVPPPEPEPPAQQHNEGVYFCRILEELHRNNELLEQLMDAVIPKYTSDIKDNMNANFDQVTQSLKRSEDLLEGVKINTRKRGL